MQSDIVSIRLAGIVLAIHLGLGSATSLLAQATCQCTQVLPFGSCVEKKKAYPDIFPGSAVVVPAGQGKPTLLYVVDLYGGTTYRYDATKFDTLAPVKVPSPLGSNATTGIAYRQSGADVQLFWAIEDNLLTTDIDGKILPGPDGKRDPRPVRLDLLAIALRVATGDPGISRGKLGGITNHESRGKLWGVDIINDVYFQMEDTGDLSLEDGKPIFFLNPKRNKLGGGAYGNTITYVKTDAGEFFDIPVGTLTDRRPSEVHRVHASNGTEAGSPRVGDPTGAFYTLGASLDTPKFVSGIAFWPGSCGAGQSSEFILDLDGKEAGASTILQVAADEPKGASIASFQCEQSAPTVVTLTWKKTLPYKTLKITRQLLTKTGQTPATVFENADFAADPERFVDAGLVDGTYEYVATVTADGGAVPSVSCRTTLGVGSLAGYQRFRGSGATSEPLPFAIAVVKNEKVLVADLNEGDVEAFDLDLNRAGSFDGPIQTGLTTGLAWNDDNDRLYWIENRSGRHFIYETDLEGHTQGSPAVVDSPLNLDVGVELGDISYDTSANYFWTVDLLNSALYGITTVGRIPDAFKQKQIANPETNGILSGGVAVFSATDQAVVLDIPLGKQAAGIVEQVGRFEYTRANFANKKEVLRLDLRNTTGASDFGGVEIATKGDEKYEFVVGIDTRTIYKLHLTSETANLQLFRRGDVNNDASLNISDPSYLLSNLFKGGPQPPCQLAGDVDGTKTIDLTDAVYLFNYLFRGGPAPVAPFVRCGIEVGSSIPCTTATCADA